MSTGNTQRRWGGVHELLDMLEAMPGCRSNPGCDIQNVVQFVPGEPATDSASSLDFDKVHVSGEVFPDSHVQVEVSYREAVAGTPVAFDIGLPFYEPSEILTMEPAEMAADKLRALAQRLRETDLAELAVLLNDDATNDEAVAKFAETKFELVKQGRANRIERIERTLGELAETYDDVVPQLFPDAPTYRGAADIVCRGSSHSCRRPATHFERDISTVEDIDIVNCDGLMEEPGIRIGPSSVLPLSAII